METIEVAARRAAHATWRRVEDNARGAFDKDDLIQEALWEAEQMRRENPDVPLSHVNRRISTHLIDYMRRTSRMNVRDSDGRSVSALHISSLDTTTNTAAQAMQVADTADDFAAVDNRLTVKQILRDYPGPRLDAEIAWRLASGEKGVDLARELGVDQTRISHRRTAFVKHWQRESAECDLRACA